MSKYSFSIGVALFLVAARAHAATPVVFSLEYSKTAEGSFQQVQIKGSEMTYLHLDPDPKPAVESSARPSIAERELKKKKVKLTSAQIQSVIRSIVDSKFMELGPSYGPLGQRAYPYHLRVKLGDKTTDVTFRMTANPDPKPEAFKTVEESVLALIQGL